MSLPESIQTLNNTVAAIASASDDLGQHIDPTKQLEFWTWWLTDAMPAAYQSARQGRFSE